MADSDGIPVTAWRTQHDRSGRFLQYETAFFGDLVLFVAGMRRDWGLMLAPPRPELAETWSWWVERPGGPALAGEQGLPSQEDAERAAVCAALTLCRRTPALRDERRA